MNFRSDSLVDMRGWDRRGEVQPLARPASVRFLSLLVLGLGLTTVRLPAQVFLNEILADNVTLQDINGNTPDWVELYNASTNAIELSGCSLSTDPTNPRRWVFPEGAVIAAGGFWVIYCDGGLPASALNTGFGLSANGDAVYFYDRATNLLDSVVFGLQIEDFSIGRQQVAKGPWSLQRPTLGAANVTVALGNVMGVKINEWMAGPLSGADWFELYNPGPNPVALGGLYLSNSLIKNPYKSQIPPLSFLGSGNAAFRKFVADADPTAGANHVSFKLSKAGDDIGLFPDFGPAIDAVTFPAQLDGVSQGRLPDGSANLVYFATTATPGKSNYLPLSNAVINEVLTHTDSPQEDAVELYNPTATDALIGGWYLSDSPANFKKYAIPAGTRLPAWGYLVFYEHQFTNAGVAFAFNSSAGDSVYLSAVDAGGTLTGYRAEVHFGAAANGVSFGRYTNSVGAVQFPAQTALSLGAPNAGPLVGPIVLNELMYFPPWIVGTTNDNVQDEFIELLSIVNTNTPLFHPVEPANTWKISGGVDFTIPPGVSLAAGGRLVVVSFDPGTPTNATLLAHFRALYALDTNVPLHGPYSRKLGNHDDSVVLERPDSVQGPGHINQGFVPYIVVDQVDYSAAAPWPMSASGSGNSLQRIDPFAYANDPANWRAALPSAGRFNPTAAMDHDQDGLPDPWEWLYGLNPADPADAQLDTDNDGLNNRQEFLAGTDPVNPSSRLAITAISRATNGYSLRFTAVAGKSYSVQYSESGLSGPWLKLKDVAAAPSTGEAQIDDPISAPSRFYRLITPQLP